HDSTSSNPLVESSALLLGGVVAPKGYGSVMEGPNISVVTRLYQSNVRFNRLLRNAASIPALKVVMVSQVSWSLIRLGTEAYGGRAPSIIHPSSLSTGMVGR